jgi:predicted dehydrogenase
MGKHRLTELEGEDTAHVLVRFANDALGMIDTSWAYNFLEENWKFHVIGEHGQLLGRENMLVCHLDGQTPETFTYPEIPVTESYALEVIDFVDCLREKRTPIQTELDGIRVLEIILAAYQSQQEKRTIELMKVQA